jgi:hypothetical protein
MSPRTIARKTLLGAAFVLYLLAIVVGVDYVFYWRYYSDQEGLRRPDTEITAIHGVTAETVRHLGGLLTSKASSFVNFPPAKPAGVLRIGALGASFTYGEEVDEVGDYPDMLAEQIRSLGVKAEVINFGSAFHGFSQTYMAWDEIARRYDLDYILLGPSGFSPDRDLRFNHAARIFPYFLHSRFIIEGDRLRRIDVIGDTHAQRFRSYFSFIPAWRYLRYDRGDPAFIAAVLPSRTYLGNPFYYDSRSERDEGTEIQRRLLQQMVQSGPPIVMGLYPDSEYLSDAFAALGGDRLCVARFDKPQDFPYLAPGWHDSPTGNAYLAQQYLSMLLGRPLEAPFIVTSDLAPAEPAVDMPVRDLTGYDDLRVELNGIDVGRFVRIMDPEPPTPRIAETNSFLRDRAVHSLIAFKYSDRSVADGAFLALPDRLDTAAAVRLVWRSDGVVKEVRLHGLQPAGENLDLAILDFPGTANYVHKPARIEAETLARLFGRPVSAGTVQLMLGEDVLLEGAVPEAGKPLDLAPTRGAFYQLRSAPSGNAAVDRGRQSGTVDFVLSAQGKAYRVPIAQWRLERRHVDRSSGCAGVARPTVQAMTP